MNATSASKPALGYEPNEVRLCRLRWSLAATLTSVDVRYEVFSGLGCLPDLGGSGIRGTRETDGVTVAMLAAAAALPMISWQ